MFKRCFSYFTATFSLGVCALMPAAAQYVSNSNPEMVSSSTETLVRFAPGSVSKTSQKQPLVIPMSAVRQVRSGQHSPFASTDPVLYSSMDDLDGNGFIDTLWGFPTLGRDATKRPTGTPIRTSTIQAAAASPNNVARIAQGQIGGPGLISQIRFLGGMYANNSLAAASTGSLLIRFYDGVDFDNDNRPLNSKIALTKSGNPAAYILRFTSATAFSHWSVDLDPVSPVVINDPQGRFGVLIAKTDDAGNPNNTPANIVWWNGFGSANGANLAWRFANGNEATFGLFTVFGNANFNQGAFTTSGASVSLSNSPLNQQIAVQGRNLDDTVPGVATLEGTVRLRGIDPPDGSDGTPTEDRPNFYTISFFQPNGGALVRTVYAFNQPSYDANGLLANYRVQGVREGNYDVLVQEQPLQNNAGAINIVRPLDIWPFADFVPGGAANVNFTAGNIVVQNVRLERFGDMDDGTLTGTLDGVVDVFDLAALISAFDAAEGDPNFLASVDVIGDPTVNSGFPDGVVDVLDLDALIQTFDFGLAEVP